MSLLRRVKSRLHQAFFADLQGQVEDAKILTARVLVNQHRARGIVDTLEDVEFKVFSQSGEDGIIQYLLDHVDVPSRSFVEFGVEEYTESNTRLLLQHNNWRGLVMDASASHVATIEAAPFYWKHDLTARCAFITRENINTLIEDAGFSGPIGLLSIDIDGNDYWVWEQITVVDPTLVVVEYNSLWGAERAVTIPYDATFDRFQAHYSGLYFGASLKALCALATRKGYCFVGSNSHSSNAFFVKQSHVGNLKVFDAEAGYVACRFRQSRDRSGKLDYASPSAVLQQIQTLPLYDVERDAVLPIRRILF